MQEKKNKQLAILLLVLIGATVGVYWWGSGSDTFSVNKKLFNDYDLEAIDQVLLESPEGKVNLQYKGARWRVNDYSADRNLIQVLFATLQQAEPKRPVATSIQDSVAVYLEENGVKVSVMSSQQVIETFYAGGNDRKTQAFFKKPGSNAPYVMTIPGYRVYASGIFEVNELGWRDKLVFDFNWRNFKSMDTRFPQAANNFTVTMNDGEVMIKGMAALDTARLNTFLDQVSLLTVEEYIPANTTLDSLASSQPIIEINILDIGDRPYSLQIYRGTARNRLFGLINNSQWAVFHGDAIAPILKPKEFFIKR